MKFKAILVWFFICMLLGILGYLWGLETWQSIVFCLIAYIGSTLYHMLNKNIK